LIAQIAEDYLSDKSKDPLVIIVNRVHKKPNHPSRLIPLLSHLGDIPIIKGNLSSKEVNSILDRLANREIRLAIAGPSIIKEGVDIPYIGGIIIAGAGKGGTKDDTSNYRHGFIQQVGRALRIGSHKPEIFLLRDSQFMFKKQSEELIVSAINAYGKDSLIYSNG
jgi:superfamily II DNA or RNA helicase